MVGGFHQERMGSIKSLICRYWKFRLEGVFGLGLEEGRDGTQFVDQIEDEENLETLRQAPTLIIGFIC
jgi:hypothetical protein